jgi:8-oxo-dGTP diphosphatase
MNNMELPIQKHTGVYGLVKKDGKILMIKKSRGPYEGMYDLPGGRIEEGEKVEEALRREFIEEVGCEIKELSFISEMNDELKYNHPRLGETLFQHYGTYYKVELLDDSKIKDTADGHDSLGSEWVDLKDIEEGKVKIPNIVKKVLV